MVLNRFRFFENIIDEFGVVKICKYFSVNINNPFGLPQLDNFNKQV